MKTLTLTSPPASEPVTLAELKTHLRITFTDEDAYLSTLIETARRRIEWITWRALVTQSWQLTLAEFPAAEIALPKAPLQSVDQIQYIDPAGVTQTLAAANYVVTAGGVSVGQVEPGEFWPSTDDDPAAVIVDLTAGFGAAAAVPADLKHALLLIAAELYCVRGGAGDLPAAAEMLLRPWMVRDCRLA